jgi:hypothetical protein
MAFFLLRQVSKAKKANAKYPPHFFALHTSAEKQERKRSFANA